MKSFRLANNDEVEKQKKGMSFFNFRISDEELEYQTKNYSNLKWSESYRKSACLIFSAVLIFTLIVGSLVSADSNWELVVFFLLPLTVVAYSGQRWAMVLIMILWTIDKAYGLSQGGNFISSLIFWVIVVEPYYKAFRVETYRRKSSRKS